MSVKECKLAKARIDRNRREQPEKECDRIGGILRISTWYPKYIKIV
jgi:hypothetical protein